MQKMRCQHLSINHSCSKKSQLTHEKVVWCTKNTRIGPALMGMDRKLVGMKIRAAIK